MSLESAADVYTKLSVGDGLVSQIPALIVSLSAGLLVSKGGTTGSAEQAVLTQLGRLSARPVTSAAMLMFVLALMPGLPLPAVRAARRRAWRSSSYSLPRQQAARAKARNKARIARSERARPGRDAKDSVKESLKTAEIELCVGSQLCDPDADRRMANWRIRVTKIGAEFAAQYGFVIPEIKLHRRPVHRAEELSDQDPRHRRRPSRDCASARCWCCSTVDRKPDVPGDETIRARLRHEGDVGSGDVHRRSQTGGLQDRVDNISVLLTHLSEVVRNNLAQLLTYKDIRR